MSSNKKYLGVMSKKESLIWLQYQHMLWFAGLRGAMAFALALRNTGLSINEVIVAFSENFRHQNFVLRLSDL